MSARWWARVVPAVVGAAWLSAAAVWTPGFRAFTSFSAARVAAGPLPRAAPPLPVVDQSGAKWDVGAPSPQYRLVQAMYLRCPDVCPIAMGGLGRIVHDLDDLVPDRLRVVSLSVDRDPPSSLEAMWSAHGAHIGWSMAALEGDSADRTLARLGVWKYRRRDGLINHSLDLLLLDHAGRVVHVFSPDEDADAVAAEVRRMIP